MLKFGELGPGNFFAYPEDLNKEGKTYGAALNALYLKLSESDASKPNAIKIKGAWSDESYTEYATIRLDDKIVEVYPLRLGGIDTANDRPLGMT